MNREKNISVLRRLRACVVRQTKTEEGCNHKCSECPYQADTDDVIAVLDLMIELYSYVVEKRKPKDKKHFWQKGA